MSEPPSDWSNGVTPWKLGLPWITEFALEHLRTHLPSGDTAMEFGSGGSTIWLAKQFRKVISIETNPAWLSRVKARLDQRMIANVELVLESKGKPYKGKVASLDFLLVDSDGTATNRDEIAARSIPWLKPTGVFVLDNYARYKRSYLSNAAWDIKCFDDELWDGKGTLIATRKAITP